MKAIREKEYFQFFNYPRRPQMNAKIESFNRTIQEDFIDWNLDLLASNINAFNHKLVDWLLWYNTKRVNSSLNNQSPLQYLINTFGFSKMLVSYAIISKILIYRVELEEFVDMKDVYLALLKI